MEYTVSFLSDIKLNQFQAFISIVTLFITALTLLSMNRTNELRLLPLLVLIIEKGEKRSKFRLKNFGDGVATNVRIESLNLITMEGGRHGIILNTPGINFVGPGDEISLEPTYLEDGLECAPSPIMDLAVTPQNFKTNFIRRPFQFLITFRNNNGKLYYTFMQTSPLGIDIIESGARYTWYRRMILFLAKAFREKFLYVEHLYLRLVYRWKNKKKLSE